MQKSKQSGLNGVREEQELKTGIQDGGSGERLSGAGMRGQMCTIHIDRKVKMQSMDLDGQIYNFTY